MNIELLKSKEVLTKVEMEAVVASDKDFAQYLFRRESYNGGEATWLNLNVYSEVAHHELEFRMERGF
jgi:hypothetical protein